MEGDAGSGQLTPTQPLTADETVDPAPELSAHVDDAGISAPAQQAVPATDSRLLAGRWPRAVLGGLAAAAVLLTGVGVIALIGHRHNAAADRDEAVAVAAAKDCITATQAPDVKAMNDSQRKIVDLGGTMRLGAYIAVLTAGSQVERAYGQQVVSERHRHRYEFNPKYRSRFEGVGLVPCGTSPDGRLVEFVELVGHPFWVGTQAHPEFKSRPDRPAPLFRELVGAALARAEGRNPHLLDLEVDVARR